jgi:hypothetical protein
MRVDARRHRSLGDDMTSTETTVARTGSSCPGWCVNVDGASEEHMHVSADIAAGAPDQPLMARLIGRGVEDQPHVLLNGRVATVEQAASFLGGVRQLLDRARLAEPGLGFVEALWANADLTFAELSAMCGVEEQRIRRQSRGEQVLSVYEYDQVALAVARTMASTAPAA